jgi:hypothetical protein
MSWAKPQANQLAITQKLAASASNGQINLRLMRAKLFECNELLSRDVLHYIHLFAMLAS